MTCPACCGRWTCCCAGGPRPRASCSSRRGARDRRHARVRTGGASDGPAMIFGVVLSIATTLVFNAGFVLEKGALSSLPPLNARLPVSLLRTLATAPRWMAGFGLILMGLAGQLVVLTRLPLTVAQP